MAVAAVGMGLRGGGGGGDGGGRGVVVQEGLLGKVRRGEHGGLGRRLQLMMMMIPQVLLLLLMMRNQLLLVVELTIFDCNLTRVQEIGCKFVSELSTFGSLERPTLVGWRL